VRHERAGDHLGLRSSVQRRDRELGQNDCGLEAGANRQVNHRMAVRSVGLIVRTYFPTGYCGARDSLSVEDIVGPVMFVVRTPAQMVMHAMVLRCLARSVSVTLAVMRDAVGELRPGSGEARQARHQQGDRAAGRGSVHPTNLLPRDGWSQRTSTTSPRSA
jgi:hypothetical protein